MIYPTASARMHTQVEPGMMGIGRTSHKALTASDRVLASLISARRNMPSESI